MSAGQSRQTVTSGTAEEDTESTIPVVPQPVIRLPSSRRSQASERSASASAAGRESLWQ